MEMTGSGKARPVYGAWNDEAQGPPGKDAGSPNSSAIWTTEDAAWRFLRPSFEGDVAVFDADDYVVAGL